MFEDTRVEEIKLLFKDKKRELKVIKGLFPESCDEEDLRPISFAHVDVDVYKSTIETLLFLDDCMLEGSFIVLDDYNRKAEGVNKAINEFVTLKRRWVLLPMFPSQAVLIHKSWFW